MSMVGDTRASATGLQSSYYPEDVSGHRGVVNHRRSIRDIAVIREKSSRGIWQVRAQGFPPIMSSKPQSSTIARTQAASLCAIATLALSIFTPAPMARAQSPAPPAAADASQSDRAGAYYHYMLAHEYEEMANTFGRP